MTSRRLAKLTPEQEKVWQSLFAIASNGGASDDEADAEAWRGLIEQFPELQEYDGIRSETLYRNHYRCLEDGTRWTCATTAVRCATGKLNRVRVRKSARIEGRNA